MRVIAGRTVEGLRRRQQRWTRIAQGAALTVDAAEAVVESLDRFFIRRFETVDARFHAAVKQAIADRYATIRVAQDEIAELEKL